MGVESASPPKVQPSINLEMGQPRSTTILLLEGDTELRKIISLSLLQQGMTVYAAPDPTKAQRILREENPDLFILEMGNPEGTNGDLIEFYRQNNNELANAVLLMTTRRPSDIWRNRYQPDVVIYKPFDIRFLVRRVTDLIQKEKTAI